MMMLLLVPFLGFLKAIAPSSRRVCIHPSFHFPCDTSVEIKERDPSEPVVLFPDCQKEEENARARAPRELCKMSKAWGIS